jgi:hypothetical protein
MRNFFYPLGVIVLLLLVSCNDDVMEEWKNNQAIDKENVDLSTIDATFTLKKEFASALAKVFASNQEVRGLVKNEALKRINYDYDVLYMLIKDEQLGNGESLEKLLLKHMDAVTLKRIEQEIPTLTIFVPSLPENSFSAETWNTSNEIPDVAIRTTASNDVPIVDFNGKEWIMHSGWIPGYPIVVVKENERIKTGTPISKSETSLRSSSGFQFAFVHDVFDNTKSGKQLSSNNETPVTKGRGTSYGYPYNSEAAARARQAYDMYDAAGIDGWQRDWVYYGISPTNTTGKYNRRYVEKVVGFQMLGNASNALNKIADQPACDPVANGNWNVKHIGNGRYLPSC